MTALGDLSTWAALPILFASAATSIAGAWQGRTDLTRFGARLSDGAAVLLLLGVSGLAYAMWSVRLDYALVAESSGFQTDPAWRLVSTWMTPAGGALTLTLIVAVAAASSTRLDATPRGAARGGTLAALASVGLAVALGRGRPFAQLSAPAGAGAGVPLALQDPALQLQAWMAYLALGFAGITFAGVIGGHLAEDYEAPTSERSAASLAAALLTVATFTAAWRAYLDTAELLDRRVMLMVLVHAASWLVAMAYLHGPGLGPVAWGERWRRVLGVALFPAVLGGAAATMAAGGGVPSAEVWTAGFAVGVLSGGMVGFGGARVTGRNLEYLPGFGGHALAGGLVTLGLAGLMVVAALMPGSAWSWIAWGSVVAVLLLLLNWGFARPFASGRKAGWPHALGLAALGALAAAAGAVTGGEGAVAFGLVAGLGAVVALGVGLEVPRLRAAGLGVPDLGDGKSSRGARAVWRARSLRRLRSMLAHLAVVALAVGLAAELGARVETRLVSPGEKFDLETVGGGTVNLTYLGLSRFQVRALNKTVASFMLARGSADSELVSAESTFDFGTQERSTRPALERGILSDVSVSIAGRGEGEDVLVRLGDRPLASLAWFGGGLFLLAVILPVGPVDASPTTPRARG